MCERNEQWDVHSRCSARFRWLPLQRGAVEVQCRSTLVSYDFLCDWSEGSKLASVLRVMSLESNPCASVGFSFFLVAGGIHVDVPYWDCGMFQGVIVHWHLKEYFYKNYTTKLSRLSASTLGVLLSWEPCITECMQWRMCICWHIRMLKDIFAGLSSLFAKLLWRFVVHSFWTVKLSSSRGMPRWLVGN